MINKFGYASEIYEIDPQDLVNLKSKKSKHIKYNSDEIVLLINEEDDYIINGQDFIKKAIEEKTDYIKVKIVFKMAYSKINIFKTLIKRIRSKYVKTSKNTYHMSPKRIRELNIERSIRSKENAYKISNKRWYTPPEKRAENYQKLEDSIVKNGYNDKYPMEIMLCRSFGVQDTINQGHHRMAILTENNIQRANFSFAYAGYIGFPFNIILKIIAKLSLKAKKK